MLVKSSVELSLTIKSLIFESDADCFCKVCATAHKLLFTSQETATLGGILKSIIAPKNDE